MRTIAAVMLALLVGSMPGVASCFAADQTSDETTQQQATIDKILSTEAIVRSRVVYKKGPVEENREAIKKLMKVFLAADVKELPDDLLPLQMICGAGLWQNIKDDDEMKKVVGGRAELHVLTDKGMQPAEGKLFQNKEDLAAFWRAFRRKYSFDPQATIRRPTANELDIYWSMIPYDITEPIFVIERKEARILAHFTETELKIAWIDDLQNKLFKGRPGKFLEGPNVPIFLRGLPVAETDAGGDQTGSGPMKEDATADGKKPKATAKEIGSVPIYVTPFYNSDGPKVAVGKFSQRLAEANADSILPLVADLEKEKVELRAEVMYVTAVRLFDLGHKDEAVAWFYRAQFRAKVFSALLDPQKMGAIGSEAFELKQAYGAFNQLAASFINVYAFGDLDKLEKTLTQVVKDGESAPKFPEIYPNVAFLPPNEWAAKNQEVATGLTKFITYIQTNADSIRKQREQNGIGK
jgi:hypothetical protein